MANKLTKEKLNLLIEQVLQEKINVRVKYSGSGGSDGNTISDKLGVPDGTATKAQYQNLAALDDTPENFLDDDDFKQAFTGANTTLKNLATNIYNKSSKQSDFVNKPTGTGGSTNLYPAPATFKYGYKLVEAMKKAMTDYVADKTNNKAEKAINDYIQFIVNKASPVAEQSQVKDQLGKLKAIIGTLLINPNSSKIDRAILATNSLLKTINKGIEIKDRELDPLGRAPKLSGAEFESGPTSLRNISSQTDSSTIAAFTAIKGNTLEEKFKNIADFSADVEKSGIDRAAAKAGLSKESLVNMAFILTYIADLSRTLSASEAGIELEKILALLMGAAKVGKGGGGLDVVQKIKGGHAFYSSKFLATGKITQSYSSADGLHNQLENGDPVYYFLGRKVGGSETYHSVKLYLLKMEPIGTPIGDTPKSNIGDVKNIDAAGSEIAMTQKWSTKVTSTKSGVTTGFVFTVPGSLTPFATLVVPTEKGVNNTIKSTANYMSDEISNSSDVMLKSISSVYQRLQNLELNTREYMGVKAGGKGTFQNSAKYIKELQTDYTGIKTDYNKAMGDVTITENKKNQTKSLKDLDKLIEHVILNKMNK